MGIVSSFFRRDDDPGSDASTPVVTRSVPLLFMLTPDAAGIAAYHMRRFVSASAMEAFIDEQMRSTLGEGTITFWGFTRLPAHAHEQDEPIEPLVIIKDLRQRDQVYAFSFSDLGAAYEYLRKELHSGLDLSQISVYWAMRARITFGFSGGAAVVPGHPPRQTQMKIVARREEHARHATETQQRVPEVDSKALRKVVRILESRGLGRSNGHSPEAPEQTTEDVRAEDVEVELGDVYGGPTRIVRRSPVGENGSGSATPGGDGFARRAAAVAGWANACSAIERALDARVAPLVSVTIAWRRISRALGEAAGLHQTSIRHGSPRRAMRAAWLNISLTLEEAALAYRFDRRLKARFAWRALGPAIEAAVEARQSRLPGVRAAWASLSRALAAAAERLQRRERARRAAANVALGLHEAAAANVYRNAMRTCWSRIAEALDEGARELERSARGLVSRAVWVAGSAALRDAAVMAVQLRIASSHDDGPDAEAEAEDDFAAKRIAIELWRFRESGRFEPRDELFHGFDSPPGRF